MAAFSSSQHQALQGLGWQRRGKRRDLASRQTDVRQCSSGLPREAARRSDRNVCRTGALPETATRQPPALLWLPRDLFTSPTLQPPSAHGTPQALPRSCCRPLLRSDALSAGWSGGAPGRERPARLGERLPLPRAAASPSPGSRHPFPGQPAGGGAESALPVSAGRGRGRGCGGRPRVTRSLSHRPRGRGWLSSQLRAPARDRG